MPYNSRSTNSIPLVKMLALAAFVAHPEFLQNLSGRRIVFEMRGENAVQS